MDIPKDEERILRQTDGEPYQFTFETCPNKTPTIDSHSSSIIRRTNKLPRQATKNNMKKLIPTLAVTASLFSFAASSLRAQDAMPTITSATIGTHSGAQPSPAK